MLTSRHLPPQRFNKTTQNTRKNFELDQNCLRFGGRLNVRYGSKADIGALPINVRFTPKSRHRNSVTECPLCAKSGHRNGLAGNLCLTAESRFRMVLSGCRLGQIPEARQRRASSV